jgi:hypothetical protein
MLPVFWQRVLHNQKRPTKRAQMKWEVKVNEKDDSNFEVQEA